VWVEVGVTPETARAVAELAEAMRIPEDEVIARAVKALAMCRAMLWTPAPGLRAQANENGDDE
jgi:hypothetical protein